MRQSERGRREGLWLENSNSLQIFFFVALLFWLSDVLVLRKLRGPVFVMKTVRIQNSAGSGDAKVLK